MRSLRSLAAMGIATCVACVFLFELAYHEPWRDEVQPALIARYASGTALWRSMRLEGVPPVVFLAMKLLSALLPTPWVLPAFAAAGYSVLLFGSYRLLASLSLSPRLALGATLALGLTDTYAYELGIVVRQYGLALGAGLATLGYLVEGLSSHDAKPRYRAAGWGALAALTSAHGACIAGAGFGAFALASAARRDLKGALLPAAVASPAFLLCLAIIRYDSDRTSEGNVVANIDWGAATRSAIDVMVHGVFPGGWWGVPRSAGFERAELWLLGGAAFIAAGCASSAAPRQLFVVATSCIVSIAALLYIHVFRFGGAYRHHLFQFMPAFVAFLGLLIRRIDTALCRWAIVAVAPWFLDGWYVLGFDLVNDEANLFAMTRSAAKVIPQHARVVTAGSDVLGGLLFWQPTLVLSSRANSGARYEYMVSGRNWHNLAPLEVPLDRECRTDPERVYVAAVEPMPASVGHCAVRVMDRQTDRLNEGFDRNKIDCACFLRDH